MSTAGSRPTSSLAAVTELLDLQPVAAGVTLGPTRTRLGVVAGRSGPRFLVPLDFPEATPEACLAYLGLRDAKTRVTRGAVGLALKAGLHRFVVDHELSADVGPDSLLALLDELLYDPDEDPGLAVAVGMGHLDEVWKPTLQVFRPDGTPAAFVKIGLGPVADRLVATEATTLAAWGRHSDPRLVVPRLIADTSWNGIRLAVVAPLPSDAHRLPPGRVSAWSVRDLDGPLHHGPLTEASWWADRRAACADQPAIDELLEQIEARHGHTTDAEGRQPQWGRWHGDWVPWNLARCHLGLIAWDWEYSEPGAPVGLDEVHGAYQQARVVEGQPILGALAAARHAAAAMATPGFSADTHLAMLITRSAELERLAGQPPADQPALLAAARVVLGSTP